MTNSMPIARVVSFLLFPDRCYPLSIRARECEYGVYLGMYQVSRNNHVSNLIQPQFH